LEKVSYPEELMVMLSRLISGVGGILILLFLPLDAFPSQTEPQIRLKTNNADPLYLGFADPPHEFTVRPFWFWNGKLEKREVERQIEEMVSQGVYGAYAHNRTGLDTPYLSEEYFSIIEAALKKSKELGFHFSVVDDYEWPSGEARDVWLKGVPSRVIAANPDFRMQSLAYVEKIAPGLRPVELDIPQAFQFAMAMRVDEKKDVVDPGTLQDLSASFNHGRLVWNVPEGRWLVTAYYLRPAQGMDGGLVDLLNPAAIRKFLDLVYEEYYRRFGSYFGNVLDSTYADHEGAYGAGIAWTPGIFETFQKIKGYDLKKYLPLLAHEGGKLTPKVRCDFMEVVSDLYAGSFFQQVSDWCRAHGIHWSGHVWEHSLMEEAAADGDLQGIMRAWDVPGVDTLVENGRSPGHFKAVASVAHFRHTRFTCENQGLQGWESTIDFQKMRLGTNMIAAWGPTMFIPHAFNYDPKRIEYPPNWFYQQPFWKYFKNYADYTRRLSYMNAQGRHVASVLLFKPTESVWAHANPVFSPTFVREQLEEPWNNPIDEINSMFYKMMDDLAEQRWDYDVADSHYLLQSRLQGRQMQISDESFQVLVMPPCTTMKRAALEKVEQFYDAGGIVVAVGFLPSHSMEEGENDPKIAEILRHIFGQSDPQGSLQNVNTAGGKAFFLREGIADLSSTLASQISSDVKITTGPQEHLFYQHRRQETTDYYWIVNDGENSRENRILFSVRGIPEKWDPLTGNRLPLYYRHTPGGTEARLRFDPWDACYVVFHPGENPLGKFEWVDGNLEDFHLVEAHPGEILVSARAPADSAHQFFIKLKDEKGILHHGTATLPVALPALPLAGNWKFTPLNETMEAPYAAVKLDYQQEGERLGWHGRGYQDVTWSRQWLSRERFTVKQWSLLGPFPNEDYAGFYAEYPPEKNFDPYGIYDGADSRRLHWIAFENKLNSNAIDLSQTLLVSPRRNWVVAYAHTFVYSPSARRVQFRVAADNNAQIWVNHQKILDRLIVPWYYEMREDFALRREAELQAGWNDVLLKISKGPRGNFSFMLRVTDEQGSNFDDLVFSLEKGDKVLGRATLLDDVPYRTWYRVPVPVGASAVQLPPLKHCLAIYFNGKLLQAAKSGLIQFPLSARGDDNVLALVMEGKATLSDVPWFRMSSTLLSEGSWVLKGLPYYSGSAMYEREFDLPPSYQGHTLVLDCGQAGHAIEVKINGKPAGVRVWLPYQFDITRLLQPGRNRVEIIVANSMENARAVENHGGQLENLKLDGLLGRVQIIPYFEGQISLRPAAAAGEKGAQK
jgi:hypothetical protein